jgi:hypothetical protein
MAAVTALVAAGAAVVGSGVQAISANQRAQKAKGKVGRAKQELQALEDSRQEIINPYDNQKSVAGLASDTSGMLKNRYNNLGVATQAAEIKIEQADIALANTLDNLAASGASAGGATALAQAALASKKDVAAGIEKQEQGLQEKRIQTEMTLDSARMSEAQRLQNVEMSEAKRMQVAETSGRDYEFKVRESREGVQLDRKQAEIDSYQGQVAANQQARDGAIGSAIGGLGNVALAAGKIKKKVAPTAAPDFSTGGNIYDYVEPEDDGTEVV